MSNKMFVGACYVDRFARDLAGVRAKIPYFKELGLTYLHIMPLFDCPESLNDGGYAVANYRKVMPALGAIDQLRDLATELRINGINLVLDMGFNHASDEHECRSKQRLGTQNTALIIGFSLTDRFQTRLRALHERFSREHFDFSFPLHII